jgi:glycosyltransferase involved in cell wall biosynthesis
MSDNIRVLQIVSNFKKNGPAFVALDLATGLKDSNLEVVVASSGGVLEDVLKVNGIQHIYLPIERSSRNKILSLHKYSINFINSIAILKKCIEDNKINLIHAHQPVPIFLGLVISKLFRIPLVTTAHNIYNPKVRHHKMYTKGALVVAVSEQVRRNMVDDFKVEKNKVITIHNGIDVNRVTRKKTQSFRKEFGIKEGEIVIGVIAGLRKQKALDVFIKSAKIILQNQPGIKFVIVGDGELRNELQQLCKTLKISNNFIFTGFREDAPQIIQELDVFCMSSNYEGLPISLLEALANHKPSVVTAVGGIPELICNGINGILVPPKDEIKLAKALERVILDDNLREDLQKNSYSSLCKNFTNIVMAKKYIEVYSRLVK